MKKVHTIKIILGFLIFLGVFSLAEILTTNVAQAMVVRGGDSYILESYATLEDDLYVLGKSVTVAGTTTGDVFSVGSYVELSGTTSEDVFIAGGNVRVTGEVTGDLRVLGGKVYLSGHVTEDVIVGGGTVTIAEDAKIDGDLFVFADYLALEGTVKGLVELHVRLAEVTGTIGDNFRVNVSEAISIKGNAHIYGNFTYKAPRTAFISETSKVEGNVDFKQLGASAMGKRIDVFSVALYMLITVVSAVVVVYFFPAQAQLLTSKALGKRGGISLIKGFVVFLAWPILSLVLIVTLLGTIPGFVLLFTYGVVVAISMMLAPVLSGVMLARWMKKEHDELKPAWASFGAMVFTLVMFLPIFGTIVRFLLFLLSFYAVSISLSDGIWRKRKSVDENKKVIHGEKENGTKEK